MIVAITGTPGTGKTTVAGGLRSKGYNVMDLNDHIRSNGLLGEFDEDRDTHDVDVSRLNGTLAHLADSDGTIFMEGHLSHFLHCDMIIVLRCDPSVLHGRLCDRGYSRKKVLENVQAEALDVILCESVDSGVATYEVDCTSSPTNTIISDIEHILAGDAEGHMPGSVDWTEGMIRWC